MSGSVHMHGGSADVVLEPTRITNSAGQTVDEGWSSSDLFDFVALRAIIFRNRWLMLSCVALVIVLSVIMTALSVPMYKSITTVEVDAQRANVLDVQDVEAEVPVQDTDQFLQTQIEILQSRALATAVAEDLGFMNNDDFLLTMNAPTPSDDLSGENLASVRRDIVVDTLIENTSVRLVPSSRIIELEVRSPDPRLAARVANSLSENYIEDNLSRRFEVSRYARQFVADQVTQARQALEKSERILNEYARQANIVNVTKDGEGNTIGSLTLATLNKTNEELVRAKAARVEAEQRWLQARNAPVMSIPAVFSNSTINSLMQQKARLGAEIEEMSKRYLDGYPGLQEKRAELDEIEKELERLSISIRNSLKDEYESSLGRERALTKDIQGLSQQRQAEEILNVQYNILDREVSSNRAQYDGLLQRYRELTATAGLNGSKISVVDKAEVARVPYEPSLVRNLILALLVGLLLAAMAAFLREQLLNRVRTPEDVEKMKIAPLLGTIPLPAGETLHEALQVKLSNVSEAYQTLTSTIGLATGSGAPKSLYVTSGRASEGKSTTAMALAKNYAQRGKRILMIDADIRRPSGHVYLGTDNEVGLTEYLSRQAALEDIIQTIPDYENFEFISAGAIAPNPAELLSSENLAELIRFGEDNYDQVVIDSPPILGLSDALLIAAHSKAGIYIMESGEWRAAQARSMISKLGQNAPKVLGIVLTKFDARKQGYDQYYQQYEYHYRGEKGEAE